ncbi:MAG TPA: radical SAM family heme chaperone HemW [Bryobacteraceae bacterium]
MAGVYISYPFCRQKCSFCNFASDVASEGVREQYHAALLEEIRSHRWVWLPETVYFGGGTPSLMPASLLADIMDAIPGKSLSEVTLECAPGTLSRESVEVWRRCGVNRVSLGVQSFVPGELRMTGRQHTAENVREDVALLRAGGIANINLDLIAGLPEQTEASWEVSLDWIERLRPPHISVYLFEADEDSRLGRELLAGGVRYGAARMPSDDASAGFYERAVERLATADYERYEISNFAQPEFESRHNLKYWLLEPYIGFGLDAHSYDGGKRWSNPDSLTEYLRSTPQEKRSTDRAEEHFFVGLRLMRGIEPTPSEWLRFAKPIEKWTATGLLERDGDRLRLSRRGVLLSNEIFEEFVA